MSQPSEPRPKCKARNIIPGWPQSRSTTRSWYDSNDHPPLSGIQRLFGRVRKDVDAEAIWHWRICVCVPWPCWWYLLASEPSTHGGESISESTEQSPSKEGNR